MEYCCIFYSKTGIIVAEAGVSADIEENISRVMDKTIDKGVFSAQNEKIGYFQLDNCYLYCSSTLESTKEFTFLDFLNQMILVIEGKYSKMSDFYRELDKSKGKKHSFQAKFHASFKEILGNFKPQLNYDRTKVKAVQKDLNNIKEDMKGNMRKVVGNLEKQERLLEKAEKLNENAGEFQKEAEEVRDSTRTCNKKRVGFILLLLLILTGGYFLAAYLRCESINITC